MFTHCCLNIVSTLVDVNQLCDNVVAMWGFWSKYNIDKTFRQCCLTFVSMFTQHCLDIHTMLLGHLEAAVVVVVVVLAGREQGEEIIANPLKVEFCLLLLCPYFAMHCMLMLRYNRVPAFLALCIIWNTKLDVLQ